jgi:hypothetical protein
LYRLAKGQFLTTNHRNPDFFIVGAPKCGTTALSEYLRGHSQVFVSTPKEPLFFCEDFPDLRRVQDLDEYLALFRNITPETLAAGEASAMYLYSKVALAKIRRFNPSARIIVMLRNPADIAYAFHSEMIYSQNEDELDFEKAWSLQSERRAGHRIPPDCVEVDLLQYRDVASIGSQLDRLLSIFPRDQVCVLVFDDFIGDTRGAYERVLAFLEIPSDGRIDFPRVNENKRVRSPWLARLTQRPPRFVSRAVQVAKQSLGLDRIHLLGALRRANLDPGRREPLRVEFRTSLEAEFASEVELAGRLIDRDLSAWSAPAIEGGNQADDRVVTPG